MTEKISLYHAVKGDTYITSGGWEATYQGTWKIGARGGFREYLFHMESDCTERVLYFRNGGGCPSKTSKAWNLHRKHPSHKQSVTPVHSESRFYEGPEIIDLSKATKGDLYLTRDGREFEFSSHTGSGVYTFIRVGGASGWLWNRDGSKWQGVGYQGPENDLVSKVTKISPYEAYEPPQVSKRTFGVSKKPKNHWNRWDLGPKIPKITPVSEPPRAPTVTVMDYKRATAGISKVMGIPCHPAVSKAIVLGSGMPEAPRVLSSRSQLVNRKSLTRRS